MSSVIQKITQNKTTSLFVGLILDALGFVSFSIPFYGEFSDMIWAPIAAYLMSKMYPNRSGKIASVIVFIEELLPFIDVIPTFTLMWIYTNKIKKQSN